MWSRNDKECTVFLCCDILSTHPVPHSLNEYFSLSSAFQVFPLSLPISLPFLYQPFSNLTTPHLSLRHTSLSVSPNNLIGSSLSLSLRMTWRIAIASGTTNGLKVRVKCNTRLAQRPVYLVECLMGRRELQWIRAKKPFTFKVPL